MSDETRLYWLRIALIAAGLIAIFGLYPMFLVWPSGWAWGRDHSHYFLMIVGVYATLGVFMILAARDPGANGSLIRFVIWSSVVHAGVMAWEAVRNPMMKGHLYGDVPALLLIAVVLGLLTTRGSAAQTRATA